MKIAKISLLLISGLIFSACGAETENANNAKPAPPEPMKLAAAEMPARVKEMMAGRGEQDSASPVLEIIAPPEGSTVESSTVRVLLGLSGDLKGYKPHLDPETKMGNHIHVILDNQPYEAFYDTGGGFELRNVADGEHTLRVFASRPWHESYKNEGSFQMVRFAVKNGGADVSRPAATNSGAPMSNSNAAANPTPEGKDMQASKAGDVDAKKPLLTYSRPKGEYKGADADVIMVDFWLTNGKLVGDGGDYRVRLTADGGDPTVIEKWAPVWLKGWTAGKHQIKLELINKDGAVVENGGYNSTTREITVTK